MCRLLCKASFLTQKGKMQHSNNYDDSNDNDNVDHHYNNNAVIE